MIKEGEGCIARVALDWSDYHVDQGTEGTIMDMNLAAGRVLVRWNHDGRGKWVPTHCIEGRS